MTSIAPFLWIALAAFVLAVPGFVMLFSRTDADIARWRPPRLHLFRRFVGLLLVLLAVVAALLAFSIYSYLQLFNDRPVAVIELEEEGPQRFRASLGILENEDTIQRLERYTLLGDAWQVDARVLRWKLPATLAGVPSLYRLDRISGRYNNIDEERNKTRSVYSLDDWNYPDLFTAKQRFPRWLPFVEPQYGSATWMPMFNRARYLILFNNRGGLLARPADDYTADALSGMGY